MAHATELRPDRPLVLWDGECGFCSRCVDWAASRDPDGELDFTPYQEAEELTPALRAACRSALHVVQLDGVVLRAGRATLFVLGRSGWPRLATFLRLPPMIWCVELGYRLVAVNRARLSRLL